MFIRAEPIEDSGQQQGQKRPANKGVRDSPVMRKIEGGISEAQHTIEVGGGSTHREGNRRHSPHPLPKPRLRNQGSSQSGRHRLHRNPSLKPLVQQLGSHTTL